MLSFLSAGFALETSDELAHAIGKFNKKNFDMVVLSPMNDGKATFGHGTHQITITKNDFTQTSYSLKSKREPASNSKV